MKKFGGILGRLVLIVLGLLLPILMLEIGVRLLRLAPPPVPNPNIWEFHPELGWWHIPDSGGIFYSSFNEYQTEVKINALRLREDKSLNSYDLAANKFKLMILADSFGEALQVPLEKTFFKRLQNLLTENGLDTQTINTGVGSWGIDQEATFFRLEGYKYQPNLTLLFFFTRNDALNSYGPLEIARNGGSIQKSFYRLDETGKLVYPPPFDPDHAYPSEEAKPKPLPPAPLLKTADWLWLHSHLYRWLAPYLRDIPPVLKTLGPSGLLGGEGRIRAAHPSVPVPFYVYQKPIGEEWQNAWALTEAILADLRRQVEANGGHLAVIITPAKEQVYPEQWAKTLATNPSMQNSNWDLTLPNRQLTQILTRQEIIYLDLLPAFQEAASQPESVPLYFTHDGHWTETGHNLTAQAIFEFLVAENLVDIGK
jgi:hypothetical protein